MNSRMLTFSVLHLKGKIMVPGYIKKHVQSVIADYNGEIPLSDFLRRYFKNHPVAGSKDRKNTGALVYAYYRVGKFHSDGPDEDPCDLAERCLSFLTSETQLESLNLTTLLPQTTEPPELSGAMTMETWLRSMLIKPDLFIRLTKDSDKLIRLLDKSGIPYKMLSQNCVALPNGTNLESILPEGSFVVQDASSQKTGDYMNPLAGEAWYDICCGAGGKSLMLVEKQPKVKLTVSDNRESILNNLQKRFKAAGLPIPMRYLADATNAADLNIKLGTLRFDHIVCDVPCSGSGTWARTPEQLYFFDTAKLSSFATRQSLIVTNAIRYLKPGGTIIYITCSVFKVENEAVVQRAIQDEQMTLVNELLIDGTDQLADSMYVATLRK